MSSFNTWKSSTVLIIVIVAQSLTEVIALRQEEVLVNESASISCFSKEVKDIQWHHTPHGKKFNEYVFAGRRFYSPYNTGRFRMDNDLTTNMFTLVITNVMHEDAGLYECKDDVLSGVFGSTHLTVLDSSLVCTSNVNPNGFVGPNTCKIEQENITFGCAVSFSGNSPNLKWSTLNGNQSLNSPVCERKDNRINCSLSMKADPSFDGSTFICQTTTSFGARHNCSIKDIRVEYFFGVYETVEKRVGDNVTCVVASNQQIRYNWTIQQNNQDTIFSTIRTIYLQNPGFYKCSVKYNIRNVTCYAPIVAVYVNNIVDDKATVTESSKVSADQGNALAIGLSIGLSMCLFAVIAFVTYKKCAKESAEEREEELQMESQLYSSSESEQEMLKGVSWFGSSAEDDDDDDGDDDDDDDDEYFHPRTVFQQHAEQLLKNLKWAFDRSEKDELREELNLPGTSMRSRDFCRSESMRFLAEYIKTHKTLLKLASLPREADCHAKLATMIERYERDSMGEPEIMSDINRKLIDFVKSSSDKVYCKFIKCLRETDQDVVADVVEKGGAPVKVKITLEPKENIADIQKEIVAKLTQLHETNSPKSEDLWLLLSQLKIGGMKISSARYDKGIVVWVWCRSKNTVAKLQQLNNDKKLLSLFSALFRCLPVSTVPKISKIECHHSLLADGTRKRYEWSVETPAIMTGQKISEIVTMGNKIIIAFQNRSHLMISTFEKEGNAIIERYETFKKIEKPMYMASSLNQQCLYITDRSNSTIWKVTFDFEGKLLDEPILWLPGSLTDHINSLSVGRNDNVLVLKEGKPSMLEIYDKEARKLNQLDLPIQIRYPKYAVEATHGDFIISYRSDQTPGGICRINSEGVWISRLDLGFKSRPIQGLSSKEKAALSSLSEGIPYLKHLDHFTLDDEDQVYACDADQYVVFLDSELNMEEPIEVKDLKNPYRIHYLKDKKQLLLVHGAHQDSFSLLTLKLRMA